MIYRIQHATGYRYRNDISVSHHIACLRPREFARQKCLDFHLAVQPAASVVAPHEDYFGNTRHFISVDSAHRDFTVTTSSTVEVLPPTVPTLSESPAWETVREDMAKGTSDWTAAVVEYVFNTATIRRRRDFADYAEQSFPSDCPILEAMRHLTQRVFQDFKFDSAATLVNTPVEDFFKNRRGVCQDFAQFAIACVRSLGLPARYVSGYLETLPPPGQPKLVGADASHAWVSIYSPGFGWLDFDPTNNLIPEDRHVVIAWGRDYQEVSPVRGVILGSGAQSLAVSVDMAPL